MGLRNRRAATNESSPALVLHGNAVGSTEVSLIAGYRRLQGSVGFKEGNGEERMIWLSQKARPDTLSTTDVQLALAFSVHVAVDFGASSQIRAMLRDDWAGWGYEPDEARRESAPV